ncbi:MAG: M20/M25/M40 family metallo-hydrolase [Mycobacterium sp.]
MDERLVELVKALKLDGEYLRSTIQTLTAIGSSPLGYRNAGTSEDREVAAFVSAEMQRIGLSDVAVEEVPVDAWRFTGARVELSTDDGVATFECSSFGGIPPTPPGGITARLVDVKDPRRKTLDKLDLRGTIVLADWRRKAIDPSEFVIELTRRGVVGVVLNCPPGGAWFQSDGALGAFDALWPPEAPPAVFIRKEDALAIRTLLGRGQDQALLVLTAEVTRDAAGQNVVGYLPGEQPGPIVVGAHHDAWFRGAFDNTTGVATLLAMAKALAESGYRPRHTICFTSRTAEEYGLLESRHDWCIGAWRQIEQTHPEWQTGCPFHLVLEASGHPALRTILEAPVELARWTRAVAKIAAAQGWIPKNYRVAPPVTGTEQWPYLIAGVPGVAAYAWETSFADTDYHTQFDTMDMVDIDLVVAQSRLQTLLLLSADSDPDAIVDHRARASQLTKVAVQQKHRGLAAAATRHAEARGRSTFTEVGRNLLALDAHYGADYPHAQAVRDLSAVSSAIAAIDAGDRRAAARALTKVGNLYLFPYLSDAAVREHAEQFAPAAVAKSWGSACHLTVSPHLWQELGSLTGDPDAKEFGPWVRAALVDARDRTERQLQQRLDAMAAAVDTA